MEGARLVERFYTLIYGADLCERVVGLFYFIFAFMSSMPKDVLFPFAEPCFPFFGQHLGIYLERKIDEFVGIKEGRITSATLN